jgi:RNAse (barnase) inhibitor barstar
MARVRLHSAPIADFDSFHEESRRVFGFPEFYGRNMNAWIDCMSSLREDDGMTSFVLDPHDLLHVEVPDAEALRERVPEVFAAFTDCTAYVNRRFTEMGALPAIALVLE